MRENFVIIGCPRTKSNLMVNYLRQHSEIYCHGELFNPNGIIYFEKHTNRVLSPEEEFIKDINFQQSNPSAYIDQVFGYQKYIDGKIVGFKILFGQSPDAIQYLVKQKEIKKIILIRNFLFTYTSHNIARLTKQWNLKQSENRMEQKINLDPIHFLAYYEKIFNQYIGMIQSLQKSGQEYLLSFAEDFPSPTSLARIFNFLTLSMPQQELKEWLRRQNSPFLHDRIENAEEIQSLFSDTFLAPFWEQDKVVDRKFWEQNPLDERWIQEIRDGIFKLQRQWKS